MGNAQIPLEVRHYQKPDNIFHRCDPKITSEPEATFEAVKEHLSELSLFDAATHCIKSGKNGAKLGAKTKVQEWFQAQKDAKPDEVFVTIHPKPQKPNPFTRIDKDIEKQAKIVKDLKEKLHEAEKELNKFKRQREELNNAVCAKCHKSRGNPKLSWTTHTACGSFMLCPQCSKSDMALYDAHVTECLAQESKKPKLEENGNH